ncbi:Longin-like domain-containing protein [Clohesyomyces aquaticus]|uniref:Synaptobrevin homolog YKT6 n=1 Tax=Clohesyomyces aquaticus TaxID=1231657 RepID=A0A1Y1ZW29_9PLEO|nr:Longin-like domain-containing protein [Clohesyomyces aquaticus]
MKVWYIGILTNKKEPEPALELAGVDDLLKKANFITVGPYREVLMFNVTTVAQRMDPEKRDTTFEGDYAVHSYVRPEGIIGVVVTDKEYTPLAAHKILGQICDEFLSQYPRSSWPTKKVAKKDYTTQPYNRTLEGYLKKYQNPLEADSMAKIQQELDETKIVLHKTIESVLERGEKLDSLIAKSDGLSAQSKMFYTQAKKQNSCCVVM